MYIPVPSCTYSLKTQINKTKDSQIVVPRLDKDHAEILLSGLEHSIAERIAAPKQFTVGHGVDFESRATTMERKLLHLQHLLHCM